MCALAHVNTLGNDPPVAGASRPHTSPRFIQPMAARVVDKLPEGDDWMYEVKLCERAVRAYESGEGSNFQLAARSMSALWVKVHGSVLEVCTGFVFTDCPRRAACGIGPVRLDWAASGVGVPILIRKKIAPASTAPQES
jgi:hypothetical protein